MPTKITMWQAADGTKFDTKEKAEKHDNKKITIDKLTKLISTHDMCYSYDEETVAEILYKYQDAFLEIFGVVKYP